LGVKITEMFSKRFIGEWKSSLTVVQGDEPRGLGDGTPCGTQNVNKRMMLQDCGSIHGVWN
jgi:hypothetical protein